MPTKKEREYYQLGFRDGMFAGRSPEGMDYSRDPYGVPKAPTRKPKRKLSAWNKFVKANSKKPRFRYRNGKLNLKKMAIAFRKKKR
tara:strand:+ start:153 stop:410 length:258 start_codon:yes stop_codon:yes gene_type:complete